MHVCIECAIDYAWPLQIVNGPTLPITIRGMGVEPQMEFSFEEHDFGPCFLHRSDMPASRKSLTVINNDKKDVRYAIIL